MSLISNSKKSLVIVLYLILIILAIPILNGTASASEVSESHEAVEPPGEHAVAEEHATAEEHVATGEHGEEAAHEEHGVEHEEPWWRFPGWEIAFAALASIFFLLLMRWLPVILEDKSGGPA